MGRMRFSSSSSSLVSTSTLSLETLLEQCRHQKMPTIQNFLRGSSSRQYVSQLLVGTDAGTGVRGHVRVWGGDSAVQSHTVGGFRGRVNKRPRTHPSKSGLRVSFCSLSSLLSMKQLFCCQLSFPKTCVFFHSNKFLS